MHENDRSSGLDMLRQLIAERIVAEYLASGADLEPQPLPAHNVTHHDSDDRPARRHLQPVQF